MMNNEAYRIIEATALEYGVSPKLLMERKRTQKVAEARQMAMYVLRNTYDYGYFHIGELFGRSHSATWHNVNKIADMITLYADVKQHYENIKSSLYKNAENQTT